MSGQEFQISNVIFEQQYSKPINVESLEEFESQIELQETWNTLVQDKNSTDKTIQDDDYNDNNSENLQIQKEDNCKLKKMYFQSCKSLQQLDIQTVDNQSNTGELNNTAPIYKYQEEIQEFQDFINKEEQDRLSLNDSLFFTKQTLSQNDKYLSEQEYQNFYLQDNFNSPIKKEISVIEQSFQQNDNIINQQNEQPIKNDISEEYFCSPNPQNLWKYGVWGTLLLILCVMVIFERQTALFIFKIKILIWIIITIVLYSWDIYFLRFATKNPELLGNVEFEITDKLYYKLKKSLTDNLCRSQIYYIIDCFWFTSNVSLNLLLCNYCRVLWYLCHFIQIWLGIIDHRYVHFKATYYFILNSSLYQYIKNDGNMVFYNLCLPKNNYDTIGTNKNLNFQIFDEIIVNLDHEQETVLNIQCKKQGTNKIDIIDEKYEIHNFMLLINVFCVHVGSHLMANFISDLDECDFKQVNKAKIAVNGLNSAGVWITSMFVHGPQAQDLLVHNTNLGIPHYPVNEKAPWVQKSQMYRLFKAILNDKQIEEIAKKYAQKKDNVQDKFTQEKLIKVGIACNFAVHGIDHWVHDRFTMVYSYCDYLRWNNSKQGFFGGRWNCDITSSFNKPCGRITEIVYDIIQKNTPQLKDGFQWTLVQ